MAYKICSTYVIDSKEHIFGCVWNTKKRGRRPKKKAAASSHIPNGVIYNTKYSMG